MVAPAPSLRRIAWFPAVIVLLLPVGVAAAEPDYSKDPVLFVHGYFLGDAGTWSFLKKRLVEEGWPEEYLFSFQFENVFGCNPKHGEEIEAHAQELAAWTGKDRFDVVCHSMGCVDARWWIRHLCGYGRVNDFVSIAGANQGSAMACLEPVSCGADQLCVGSGEGAWKDNPFLLELNQCDMTPWDPIRYTAIWTSLDEIVVPSTNSKLDGALNIEMQAVVGHALILSNEETLGYLEAALDGGGKNDNAAPGPQPCVDECDSFPVDPLPEPVADGGGTDAEDVGGQSGDEFLSAETGEASDAFDIGTDDCGSLTDAAFELVFDKDGQGPGTDTTPEVAGETAATADAPPLHLLRRSQGGCGAGRTGSASTAVLLALMVFLLRRGFRKTTG